MKLIESDGKKILKTMGIAVPEGQFVREDVTLNQPMPCYVKAQILQGGRGLGGLVRRCDTVEEIKTLAKTIENALIVPCAGIWCESAWMHDAEWLVSIDINRGTGKPCVHYSASGGGLVHEVVTMDDMSEVEGNAQLPNAVKETLKKLWDGFAASDALSIEINPLALRKDGSYMALDAKVELDDAAAFRHPEWSEFAKLSVLPRELSTQEKNYVEFQKNIGHRGTFGKYLELDGNIALILSGGGASIVAMDALKSVGGKAANYLEISGNPEGEAVKDAVKIAIENPQVQALWVAGSFANFTNIQEMVSAILLAVDETKKKIPIVIRRDGPNAQEANDFATKWASDHHAQLRFHRADIDLYTSARELMSLMNA